MNEYRVINFPQKKYNKDDIINTAVIEDRLDLLQDIKILKHYLVTELRVKEDHLDFLIEQSGNDAVRKLRELYYEVIKFDVINNTKTSSYINETAMKHIASVDSSQFANVENVCHGVKYRASLTSVIKTSFEQAEKILRDHGILLNDVSAFDIGSGLGKPLLVALGDLKLPLKKAVGLDYFKKMVNTANRNANIMGLSKKIEFKFADATKFKDFDNINIIYMYNPFDKNIMSIVEHNIRTYGGKTIVAYNKPLCADLFSQDKGWKLEMEQKSPDPDSEIKIFSYGL